MKKIGILAMALMLAGVGSLASAQEFSEDFESYPSGAALHGLGGWKGWDNAPGAGAPTSSTVAYSGKNSVEILGSSDLVHEFTPNGGKWEFTAMQYIPSGKSGITYFILLNQYASGRDWSVQTQYDLATGTITADYHSTNSGMKIVCDKWVKIRLLIDLTANTAEEYYNGVLIAAGQWDDTNHTTLEAIDLYGNNAASVYYDDIRLTAYIEPTPADGAIDVLRETQLSWAGGDTTAKNHVYFGASYADVEAASVTNPLGVLVSTGQSETTFDPGRLDIGQIYYWRVDKTGGTLGDTVAKGRVWSFTAEPFSYRMNAASIVATASSVASAAMGPAKTIDGSGLNAGDQHSMSGDQMWLSSMGDARPWVQYEFDKTYSLEKMLVWNSNQGIEPMVGLGVKAVAIETSTDGQAWTALGDFVFAQGTGLDTYAANTTVDFTGAPVRYVKLAIQSNWGGIVSQFGLSEVRFFWIPTSAREPNPASGATAVSPVVTLSWRPGREAASHQVFLGTDAAALSRVGTVDVAAYQPELAFNQAYFWKVVEANEAETPSLWESEVWSFSTGGFIAVDDFESYNDDTTTGTTIYETWMDGLTDKSSGSQVGYDASPFAETRIVHGGKQSMPLRYNNSASPFFSQAERTFDAPQNWTVKEADTLSLYFQGVAPAFVETAPGSILMNAIGADIWGNSDQFRYVCKTLNGNGTMVARVDSLYNSNAWAKGGVMIRQSVQVGSAHGFMAMTPSGGNGASFQHRLATSGASTNNDSTTAVAIPYWVKVERNGNSFTGSISPDGKTWTQLGTAQTIPMVGPVLIGLALCSHDAAIATGAEFSNISTTGNVTGAWQVAEIGAAQPAGNSVERLYVTLKDSSGKSATVINPDAAATGRPSWQQWKIPLSEFTAAGVKVNAVKSMTIGVGNKAAPAKGGAGTLFIDDIGFGRPLP